MELYFNTPKYRLASYYFEKVQGYEEVKTNRELLMGLLSTMLECYRMNNDLEKTMKTALYLLEIAEKDGRKDEVGRAYLFMAEVLYEYKDKGQAEKYFELAEQMLEKAENIHYRYHFYISYANTLIKDGQYTRALDIIAKAKDILPDVATDSYMTRRL